MSGLHVPVTQSNQVGEALPVGLSAHATPVLAILHMQLRSECALQALSCSVVDLFLVALLAIRLSKVLLQYGALGLVHSR